MKSVDNSAGRSGAANSSWVVVLGHSFGALLLERALNPTCIDPLVAQWWQAKNALAAFIAHPQPPNPLPIDLILFVNSAAPSIYAKEMGDFLPAHHSVMLRGQSPFAFAPLVLSLTSSADWATGTLHPLANVYCRFYPSLPRVYDSDTDGLLKIQDCTHRRIRQSQFYRRTPGHQPLLVEHWLVEDKSSLEFDQRQHQTAFDLGGRSIALGYST